MTLTSDQYARLTDLFGEALDLGLRVEQARAFAADRAGDDPIVASRLIEMLKAHGAQQVPSENTSFTTRVGRAVRRATMRIEDKLDAMLPASIGPYKIVRFVDTGGMGTVYEAEQAEPRRRVALKVIRRDLLTEENVRRFEAEGNLLARLSHPGIAEIFTMGRAETPSGVMPYIVMEFVEGKPITTYAQERELDVRARIRLLMRVCQAVQYAHDNGVLHRDIKPSNILVDDAGEPHVLDFGIARPFDDAKKSWTSSGPFVGTLAYASPEQACGGRTPLDVRTDVYGLGAVGYEVLTGKRPHELGDMPFHEAARIVIEERPVTLSAHSAALRGDVAVIFAMALAKERERRYTSVRAFEGDLSRFLRGEPIAARPPSRLYQTCKLIQRHRLIFVTSAATVLLLVGFLVTALTERRSAVLQRQEADAARRAALVSLAATALERRRGEGAFHAMEILGPEPTWEWRYLRARLEQALDIETVSESPDEMGLGATSPNGRWYVAATKSGPLVLHILNLRTKVWSSVPIEGLTFPCDIAFSRRTPVVALSDNSGRLQIVDLESARKGPRFDTSGRSTPLDYPEQDLITARVSGDEESTRHVVDLRSGRRVDIPGGYGSLRVLRGRYAIAWNDLEQLPILDLATGATIATVRGDQNLQDVRMGPKGRWLVALHRSATVFDLHEARPPWQIDTPPGVVVRDACFDASGARIGLSFSTGSVQIVDPAQRTVLLEARDRRLARLQVNWYEAVSCWFDPQTNGLCTLYAGNLVRWPSANPVRRLRHADDGNFVYHFVYAIAWHPRGRWLASAGWDRRLVIWDTYSGRPVRTLRFDGDDEFAPRTLVWSPSGRYLAAQMHETALYVFSVWDGLSAGRGQSKARLMGIDDDGWITLVAENGFHRQRLNETAPRPRLSPPVWPDQRAIPEWVRNTRHARPRSTFDGITWGGGRVAFRVEAKRDVVGQFVVSDAAARDPAWIGSSRLQALALALTRSGDRLFVGLRDGTVALYDVRGQRRLFTAGDQGDYIAALELTRDDRTLASGSGDGTIHLWDTRTAAELALDVEAARRITDRVRGRVEQLMEKLDGLSAVIAALARDDHLSPAERDAAFALALDLGP